MRVLVTGGTGFTGSALCSRLTSDGHEVHALDTKPGFDAELLQSRGVKLHLGSVTDRALVDRLAHGCERIFHLAAAFRLVNLGKRQYWDINVGGTRNVLEVAASNGGIPVVNCSTCGVHGNVAHPPASEEASISPADYYQYTKWEGEKLVQEHAERGRWVTTLRPAAIYGPGDPERFYLIFKRVLRGRFLFLGDGSAYYHPLYIDNLVDAFLLAAQTDAARGQAFLIADEEYLPIRDLVRRIAASLGVECKSHFVPFWPAYLLALAVELVYKPFRSEPPIFRRRLDWFRQNRAFDITKAKRLLGYQPRIGLDDGLRRTGAWYRQQGLL